MPPTMTATPTTETAGAFVLRRLSNREYNHVVADLLGDTTRPADDFPDDDVGTGGFVSPTNVATLNAQHYEETAGVLAEAALAANKLSIPCTSPASTAAETTCAQNFINQFGKLASGDRCWPPSSRACPACSRLRVASASTSSRR
jgi:hypothetical protein